MLRAGCNIALAVIGMLSFVWSISVLPTFWFSAQEDVIANQIQARASFKLPALTALLANDQAAGRLFTAQFPQKRKSDAFVRYAMVEQAFDSPGTELDRYLEDAQAAIHASLELAPCDAYFLFAAYSLANTRAGYAKENLRLLDASYKNGPFEGWISVMRNQLALAVFPDLKADTQRAVLAEFAAMVDSGLLEDAGRSLVSAWPHRDMLLASLAATKLPERERFARTLIDTGIRVSVPGVDQNINQPWR
jgi:hypothetical protein